MPQTEQTWEKLAYKLVTLPEQVGAQRGLSTSDIHEAAIFDPDEAAYRVGFDDQWAKGVLVPLTDEDATNMALVWKEYLDALNWAVATVRVLGLHGPVGKRLPREVWDALYPALARTNVRLHRTLRKQIVQAAYHSSKNLEALEYLPVGGEAYRLVVPHESHRHLIEPGMAVLTLLGEPQVQFLAAMRMKRVPFGAAVGRMRVFPPQIVNGITSYPLTIRTRCAYIQYGTDEWRVVKALAARLRGEPAGG